MKCYFTNGVGHDDVMNTMTMKGFKTVIQDDRYINILSTNMGQEHVAIPDLAHVKLFRNVLSQNNDKNIVIGHHLMFCKDMKILIIQEYIKLR